MSDLCRRSIDDANAGARWPLRHRILIAIGLLLVWHIGELAFHGELTWLNLVASIVGDLFDLIASILGDLFDVL